MCAFACRRRRLRTSSTAPVTVVGVAAWLLSSFAHSSSAAPVLLVDAFLHLRLRLPIRCPVGKGVASSLTTQAARDDSFFGLTDDGDYAIIGINEKLDDDGNDGDSLSAGGPVADGALLPGGSMPMAYLNGIGVSPLSSTSMDRSPAQHQFAEPQPTELRRPRAPVLDDDDDNDPDRQELLECLEEWLVESIPTLQRFDVTAYAQNLVNLGFDPDCITSRELRWKDLAFMKMLHRRYLYYGVLGREDQE